MSRNSYAGPKLPKFLLDQVHAGQPNKGARGLPRKDRRKAERQQKKSDRSRPVVRTAPRPQSNARMATETSVGGEERGVKSDRIQKRQPAQDIEPLKSPLKQSGPRNPPPEREASSEIDLSEEIEDGVLSESDSGESENETTMRQDGRSGSPSISRRAAKAGMASNDAEIASLERKLGIKSKHKDDELDYLLGGLDGDSDSDEQDRNLKRKRPEDSKWLRDKRMKASGIEPQEPEVESDSGSSNADSDSEDLENPFSDDELSNGDFEGFSSDEKAHPSPPRKRENPYVAPVTDTIPSVDKYVPPSLRKAAASDVELLKQLRRQIQGQLNRLSEANILSILQALEQIYEKNARQHVTSTLVELLVNLIADPSALNDTFLILHAGFAAAVYKVIGTDFGAHLLERVVEKFDEHYKPDRSSDGKQTLNMVAFLANLYSFHVIGSAIMFDYIRLLLAEITEGNAELLLRVIRTSGSELRQDDPSSLKDIVVLVQRNVANAGEQNLSVRTKFMIETINNLKNNRMKTGATASAIAAEHTTRIKKSIGSLSSRSTRTTEPLRITLSDIRESDKKGKWWLVGASFHDPAKLAKASPNPKSSARPKDDLDAGYESETPGNVSIPKLARSQGMNTDIRRAIFMSIMSASDFQDAHIRLLKLRLTSKQELEIPRVLLNCAGAEQAYNPFYTLVARKLCEDTKKKKAFQFALWNALDQLRDQGETDEYDEDAATAMSTKRIVNLAKMYGSLVADRGLSITILKTMEFALLSAKAHMFAEVLLTTVMLQVRRKNKETFERTVKDIFAPARAAPAMIQGLGYFVKTVLIKAELANGKSEQKTIIAGCHAAEESLALAAEGVPLDGEAALDSDSE